jgi:RimJ/RimL family protein N-acetyltransferase
VRVCNVPARRTAHQSPATTERRIGFQFVGHNAGPRCEDDLVDEDGPHVWVTRHADVRLRPVDEQDLALLARIDTEPALTEPFEWRGFRDPKARRRRWEQDSYLGPDDALLIVALPDSTPAGIVSWRTMATSGPRVTYIIGILLMPEHRERGIGSSAQCLVTDHLFCTTLANRVEAGTAVENVAEQRALEKAGFQQEGRLRGGAYLQGRIQDGFLYSRLRSDPHP